MTFPLAAATLAALALTMLIGYTLGRTANTRRSAQYKRGLDSGYRKGRIEGERERDRLQAQLDDVRQSFHAYVRADARQAADLGDDALEMVAGDGEERAR